MVVSGFTRALEVSFPVDIVLCVIRLKLRLQQHESFSGHVPERSAGRENVDPSGSLADCMELTPSLVAEKATAYRTEEPLYAVESDHLEILPKTFESGEYGRRDAQWPIRWYYRRHLGAFPDAKRRDAESRFRDNEFEAIKERIEKARTAESSTEAIEALTELPAVDTGVASAFLFFIAPSRYVAVGAREWQTLREAGKLDGPYPGDLSPADYERYLGACRRVTARVDCDLWTLYRALWRLSDDTASR